MYNFIEEVGLRYSEQDAQSTRKLLGDLNLLVPRPDQYMLGKEHMMIFLNPFGVVLRIGDPLPCPEQDLILKPLKSVRMNKAVLEIMPGIECGVNPSSRDMHMLQHIFTAERYDFWDWDKPSNLGYLPARASPFDDRVPVVLDRGAIRADDQAAHPRVKEFRVAGEMTRRVIAYRGIQERVFAPLLQTMQAAWPDATNQVDPTTMLEFWKQCRSEIAKRDAGLPSLLCNQWQDNSGSEEYFKTRQARDSSFMYGERYAQHLPA
jgi:hypothetical protein